MKNMLIMFILMKLFFSWCLCCHELWVCIAHHQDLTINDVSLVGEWSYVQYGCIMLYIYIWLIYVEFFFKTHQHAKANRWHNMWPYQQSDGLHKINMFAIIYFHSLYNTIYLYIIIHYYHLMNGHSLAQIKQSFLAGKTPSMAFRELDNRQEMDVDSQWIAFRETLQKTPIFNGNIMENRCCVDFPSNQSVEW